MYSDVTVQMYFYIGVVATIGVILFVYWMIRYDWYHSVVFIYVTILLAGEAVRSWINLWGRYTLLTCPGEFLNFTMSWMWSSRLLLSLVSVTAIVGHMCYRAAVKDKKLKILSRKE